MLVKDWMTPNPPFVQASDSMQAAIAAMKENQARLLPVLDGEKLVGVVTDRDLKRASPSDANLLELYELIYLLHKIKVRDVMTRNPVVVHPLFTVEETARLLLEKDISGAPVLENEGRLVGVITQKDLFRVLVALTGVSRGGVKCAFSPDETPGSVARVANIVRKYGGRMVSILSSDARSPAGQREVYLRMHSVAPGHMKEMKEELKKAARIRYIIDHDSNTRELVEE